MGVYVLTDGSGTYICKDEATGRYVPIRSFKHAKQWDSILKAKSVLDNSISKSIRNSYAVQLVDTEEIIEKESKKSGAIKAGFFYTICNFIVKGAVFLTTPIFTRIMSSEDIGAFSNLSSWLSFWNSFYI